MLMNSNKDTLEKRLSSMPQPSLREEVKMNIHRTLMEQESTKHFGTKGKQVFNIFAGAAVVLIFCITVFTSVIHQQDHGAQTESLYLSTNTTEKNIRDLLPYRDSYIGDNGAVIGILNKLPVPNGQNQQQISLQTKKSPYGLTVNYNLQENSPKDLASPANKGIFLYNSTCLFILIQNVEQVTFHFATEEGPYSFTISRNELEDFYKMDLHELSTDVPAWTQTVIEETLADKTKVEDFYASHPLKKE